MVFTAFGAGLSWGAAVVRWGDRIEPIATSDAELPPNTQTTMELLEANLEFFGRPTPAAASPATEDGPEAIGLVREASL